MKIKKPIIRILMGAAIGLCAGAVFEVASLGLSFPLFLILAGLVGTLVGATLEAVRHRRSPWADTMQGKAPDLQRLPVKAAQFLQLVIRKMRYRRKVQQDVMAELAAHFQDELRDCKTDEEKKDTAEQLINRFGDVKLLAVLLRRAKKRCRPLWRTIVARTFQTIGVLILCFIVYCVYISVGKPTIRVNYIEQMTRLTRPVADENLNAAPLYQKAMAAYKEPPQVEREVTEPERGRSASRPVGPREGKGETGKKLEKVGFFEAIGNKDRPGDLTEAELSALKQWISDNAHAVQFFKQASERPHCWWHREVEDNHVIGINWGELAPIRGTVRAMCWRAKVEASEGNVEAALDDVLSCLQAGRHFKGPRMLIEQLVGIAIQALSLKTALVILDSQEIDTQLLKGFHARLQELMAQYTFVVTYQTEKFFALDFIQRCYTDDGAGSGHLIPGRLKEYWGIIEQDESESEILDYMRFLAASLVIVDRREIKQEFNRLYSTAEEWADKTPWQLKKENVNQDLGPEGWPHLKRVRYMPVSVLMPAVARVGTLAHRAKTEFEAVISIVAIERYKRDHGDYPESLDRLLESGLLKKLPMDPYSDTPLIYRKTDGGFTLYSVAENFADDGGTRYDPARGWGEGDKGDRVFWPLETYGQEQKRLEEKKTDETRLIL